MAHVFKPTTVKPIPANAVVSTVRTARGPKRVARWTNRRGRPVTADVTPDGRKCRVPSPTWWIEYTTAGGGRDRKPGFRDRSATQQLASDLERAAEDVRAGRESPRGAAPGHMIDHLPSWRAALERKGSSVKHVGHTVKQVRTVLTGARLSTPATVSRETVERWLDEEQRRLRWGARTRNQWAGSLNQFGRWLVREKKSRVNPFDGLARQNVEADRRRVRRVLDPDDLTRLVTAARDSADVVRGLAGIDRAMLYTLAAYTGRRLTALRQMTAPDVLTDDVGLPVAITTSARMQKSKKAHTVPVHPELAADLAAWLASRPRTGPLFAGWKRWADRGADIVRHDLAAARAAWIAASSPASAEREKRQASDRLCYHDHTGEVFDFHALRGQFITSLALAGVSQSAAVELADHSDPKLTAKVYTKWANRLAPEVAKLPAPGVRLASRLGSGLGFICRVEGTKPKTARDRETKKPRNRR